MNSTIDDCTLIRLFLEGNDDLISNGNLMIQTNSGSTQLLATWEGVVATIKRVQYTPTISLCSASNYYELIREMLIERHFLPLPVNPQTSSEFEQYRRQQVPDGYVMKYTLAKLLWREWRFTWNERSSNRLRRGILLLTRNNWYPIQDIGFHQGLLIVKTLVSSVTVQPDDRMIWLSQTREPARAKLGIPMASPNATESSASTLIPPSFAAPIQAEHNRDLVTAITTAAQSHPSFFAS